MNSLSKNLQQHLTNRLDNYEANQVFTLNTAHKIWLKLQELHDDTTNVHEQKHCLAKQNYDSFEMNDGLCLIGCSISILIVHSTRLRHV